MKLEDFWDHGAYEHWKDGDPTKLAETLRSGKPLNTLVRNYLADLLEGKVSRPRGRKPNKDVYGNPDSAAVTASRMRATITLEAEKAAIREQHGTRDIEREAIENTAEKLGMKPGQVSHLLYPRRKNENKEWRCKEWRCKVCGKSEPHICMCFWRQ